MGNPEATTGVNRSALHTVFRIGVGLLFVYAGLLKLLDIQQFAIDVQNFRLTPWSLSLVTALYLPWLEILAGATFASGFRRLELGAYWTLVTLVGAFIAALGSAWARGLDIECGCFGEASGTTVGWALLRALALGGVLGALRVWRVRSG
jgi:uncharacterized membrane protein YphA (DoxX/SURF4 family)